MDTLDFQQFILPVSLILGGFLLGIIIDKIVLKKLQARVSGKVTRINAVVLKPVKGMFPIWFLLMGITQAMNHIELENPNTLSLIKKSILIIIIFSVTIVATRMAAGFVTLYKKKVKGVMASPTIFINFIKISIFIIGFLIVIQSLGISIAPILTALGVGGLAVALALQDTLSNLFAGFHILASRQIAPGDYVKLESGEEGYVRDVTWRNTVIEALQHNMIVVPNSRIASTILTNFNQPFEEMRINIHLGVSYESDLQKVEKVTLEVANEVMSKMQGGIPNSVTELRYHTFDDFSINFRVILRTSQYEQQYFIQHQFIKKLHERYNKEGIVIPFPIRTVHMHDKDRQTEGN